MDYPPHQIVRMVQLGLKERVLSSSTIWICATCETCATRCPNEVEVAHLTFLSVVKHLGRQHEVSLVALLKMRSKNFFDDMILGTKLFLKGKLRLKPYRIRGVREIKEIYRSCGL
jgi:heterodisulfide reductase subunit C